MWSIFCAIKRSWTEHFVEQFSATIILLMTYSALLFVALSLTNVQNLFEMWGEVQQVTVYLKPDTNDELKAKVLAALKSEPMVEGARIVGPEESAKSFENRFSKVTSQKIDAGVVSKYFPTYFILDLNQTLAYKSGFGGLDEFVERIKTSFQEVGNVSYGKSWLQRYVSVLSAVRLVGWFLISAFLIAAVIVSSSIIKTILFSRREEIEILEFVGADDISIYLPQIINTLILTALSYGLAIGLNYALFLRASYASSQFIEGGALQQLSFVSPTITIGLFALSMLSVLLYSSLTIFNLLPRRKRALLVKEVLH